MRTTSERGSLWELAVLCLLREEPMHPYEMQRLLRDRHKDDILDLRRGSLYHAIDRLLRARLIEVVGVSREGRRPERTTYRLTPAGRKELLRWLRQRIANPPGREPSEFMGSLSFLVHLAPGDAALHLEARARALEGQIEELASVLTRIAPRVGRVNLIESEYLLAMRRAELVWCRELLPQLRSGRFGWDLQGILRQVRAARRKGRPGEASRRKERRA